MTRLRRLEDIFQEYPLYLVTAVTFNRNPILIKKSILTSMERFAVHGESIGAIMGRYVLMPDHLHAFVSLTSSGPSLSAWMKALKNSLSKCFREDGLAAPHWQKGFHDHLLRTSESYEEKWDYVKMNQIRAGLVKQPEDWPWQGEPFRLIW